MLVYWDSGYISRGLGWDPNPREKGGEEKRGREGDRENENVFLTSHIVCVHAESLRAPSVSIFPSPKL